MEEYGVSRTEYTAKWGTLRGQLLRDYNKHVRSKQSGAAADSVFHPTWKWYTHLHFLKTGEEVLNESTDTDIGLDESQNSISSNKSGKHLKDLFATKKRLELLDKSIAFIGTADLGCTSKSVSNNMEDTFGKMVSETLLRFTPYQQMFAKKRINDVLFEVEYATFQQSNVQMQQSIPSYSIDPISYTGNIGNIARLQHLLMQKLFKFFANSFRLQSRVASMLYRL